MEFHARGGFVTEETIQFLLCGRRRDNLDAWEFPGKEIMDKIFEYTIANSRHPELLNVAISSLIDDQGFPVITL